MSKNITDFGNSFREKFNYTGKLTKECMGKELWNEYCKMKSKERCASPEHKNALAERKEQRHKKHIATLRQKKETGAYLAMYCKDYTKIENYEKAVEDKFVGWQLHHRLETHTSDGERRTVDIEFEELKALDMYYNRPPEELILMKTTEHRRLHLCGKPNINGGRKKSRV
jgi:hypothetical protein